ncbi:MAG: permease [Eubacteriales bacterium]
MFTYLLYVLAIAGLITSFLKSTEKTKKALKKAWKSFENILPQFLVIILIIGIMLSILDTETITKLLGADSGFLGVIIAAVVGSITLIPGFVAFPLAAALLNNGAGVTQIAAFVSTLMMVGIVTIPMEIETFGKKVTIIRNLAAFVFSLFVAILMGVIL